MNRAVFLDRDGVLTRALIRDGNAYAPITPDEMHIATAGRQLLSGDQCVLADRPEIRRQPIDHVEQRRLTISGEIGTDFHGNTAGF